MNTFIIYAIIFLYGLLIGSFLNVCIYRIPKKDNIVISRSHCMNCNQPIKWYDLIPVFSFLILGGRCRSCKAKISIQYPLIEFLNGLAYVLVFYINDFTWLSVIRCFIISSLIVIIMINYRTDTVPTGIIIFDTILAFAFVGLKIYITMNYYLVLEHVIGAILGACALFLIFLISKKEIRQFHEICFAATIGFMIGWKIVFIVLSMAMLLNICSHILKKYKQQCKTDVYGTFIALSVAIILLFEKMILR